MNLVGLNRKKKKMSCMAVPKGTNRCMAEQDGGMTCEAVKNDANWNSVLCSGAVWIICITE